MMRSLLLTCCGGVFFFFSLVSAEAFSLPQRERFQGRFPRGAAVIRQTRGGSTSSAASTVNAETQEQDAEKLLRETLEPYSNKPEPLPDAPSPQLVCFVWASNAVLLAPVGVVAMACGLQVGGAKFAMDFKSAILGVLCSLPWLALSLLPLDEWFSSLRFLRDVTQHTELFTATLLGSKAGGLRRLSQVALFSTMLSISAGVFEELAFRGTAQRLLKLGLVRLLPAAFFPAAGLEAVAIVVVSGAFGMLHNYCRGYAALAALAGAYFGAIYALTRNLFVASVCHAVVDLVAFGSCYASLLNASAAKREELASRDFATTTTLRAWRMRFDNQPPPPPSSGFLPLAETVNVQVL